MQAYLQSFQNIGSLTVIRGGDCAGYSWSVRWNEGGNKFPIDVFIIIKFILFQTIIFFFN